MSFTGTFAGDPFKDLFHFFFLFLVSLSLFLVFLSLLLVSLPLFLPLFLFFLSLFLSLFVVSLLLLLVFSSLPLVSVKVSAQRVKEQNIYMSNPQLQLQRKCCF